MMQQRPNHIVSLSLTLIVLLFTLAIVVSFLARAGRLVLLFAIDPGSERVESPMDNTSDFNLLLGR